MTPSRKDRSRTAILDASEAAFAELGFDNVSMDGIARRAGLTRMTVYNLFAAKDDIAIAIGDRAAAKADPWLRPCMEAGESAADLLREALMGSAEWCLANPTIAAINLRGRKLTSLQPPAGAPSFHGITRDIFALGQRQGLFRSDEDPNDMALVLLGGFAQLILFALAGTPFDPARVELLLRLNIEGFGARSINPKGQK